MRYPGWLVTYRKIIPLDILELEFVERLRKLQPSADIVVAARAMLEDMWEQRSAHLRERRKTLKASGTKIEAEIESFLDRIVDTGNPSIISAYEKKISEFQRKLVIVEEEERNFGKDQPEFEELFEHNIDILSRHCYARKKGF